MNVKSASRLSLITRHSAFVVSYYVLLIFQAE